MSTTLTTARLVLRPVQLSDAPAIQRHFGTWQIIQYMTEAVPWPYPDDGALCFLRDLLLPSIAEGRALAWAITRREDPAEAIGLLHYRCGEGVTDNRGFWLAHAYQGRGYMTEAVTAFQDHIFFELGVEEIYVCNAITNVGSRRVKEKTGAELVGTLQMRHRSGETETQRWVVTRERWAQIRGRAS